MRPAMPIAILCATLAMTPAVAADFLTKPSPYDVAETVERLENAMDEGGAKVIATVDHAAAAGGAGMELRPTTLVISAIPEWALR